MTEPGATRVAVYLDFDNIVISRYNQLYGRGAFGNDAARNGSITAKDALGAKLHDARVDVGAILDFASSFGSIVVSRAYADWSLPVNAGYQRQLIDRAVDLTQLFNTSGTKNGADIRLAVDVVEDLFRLDDLTHVVIVAGDSDFIALAQRCKRLGRFVVGVGVAGATSRALVAAVDQFSDYDDLPGVERLPKTPRRGGAKAAPAKPEPDAAGPDPREVAVDDEPGVGPMSREDAAQLLHRALELLDGKNDEEWQTNGEVKQQMLRLDPSFKEKPLGYKSFTEFLQANQEIVEIKPRSKANDRRLKSKR